MTNLGGPSALVRELAEEVRQSMHAGDLAAAEAAAERALSLAPGLGPLVNLLGLVRLGQARFADAEALFARAADADRRCAEFHANRGIALKSLGRPDEALQSLRRASTLSADPAQSGQRAVLGRASRRRDRGAAQGGRARAALERAARQAR